MNGPESGALAGIRVLELGEGVSAPYAAKLLADLGADVIKVEPVDGDSARRRGPFAAEPDVDASGLFLALNTNKRSLVAGPQDGHLVRALLNQADIVITNLAPHQFARFGLDEDGLDQATKSRPELVVCSITAFGLDGPYASYRAEELTVTHAGGWAYQCPGASSETDQPPLKVFGHQADFHAGVAAATVCLGAYYRAEQGGQGDFIDFSSVAHTAGMLEAALIAASYLGDNPSRLGSRLINPWGIFDCLDGKIFLVTVEQDQWERLVEMMDHPEWVATGLFDTNDLRLENEDLLSLYLQEWIGEWQVDELWRTGQAKRICFAPVLTMADLASQAHLQDRGFLVDVDHPRAGTVTHLGQPFQSSPPLWGTLDPAPILDPAARPTFADKRSVPHRATTSTSSIDPESGPLAGVRVLDLSWVWAGPYGTLHLAHLGAEVIKVESALRPGLGRRLPLHPLDVEPTLNTCAYFNQWDQGKLSCQLDLSHPGAIEVVEQLVAQSDVVVENFATGVMERLGLGYERLCQLKPDIIVASISGYGSTGPLRDYMGYGPTTGPLSGLTALTGYQGGPPRELGISVGDPGAGITAALAICAALTARQANGQGCYLDVALWESTASFAVEGWMNHALGNPQRERMGNRDPLMAPHNCYRTAATDRSDDQDQEGGGEDPAGRWLSIACATDQEWQALARLIDPGLVEDARFVTAEKRKRHEDALDDLVAQWVRGQDRWLLTETLQDEGIAAFPSMSPQDLLRDPNLWDRQFFEELDHPEVGRRIHAGIPWCSTTGPNGVARAAPILGQHTNDIFGRVLGLSAEQIATLRQQGICQ